MLFGVGSCSLACQCTGGKTGVGGWKLGRFPGSGEGPGTAECQPGSSPAHRRPILRPHMGLTEAWP